MTCAVGLMGLTTRSGWAQEQPPEQPVATEPVATEPVATEPVAAEPAVAEPAVATQPSPGTQPAPAPQPAADPQQASASEAELGPPDPASLAPGRRPGEPRFTDANVDRVILFSTAETHPKNTFFFSNYELILLQFGYAVSDRVQLALTGIPPLIENQPYFFDLSAKVNVLRDDVVRVGLLGAGIVLVVPDVSNATLFGARLNAVGQFCFDTNCGSSFSANAGTIVNSESNEILPVTLAGGFVVRASSLLKLLAEPAYALAIGDNADQPDGFLFSYGLRLSGTNFGFDLAFIKPVGMGGDDPFILGLPWVALTYRTDGDRPRGAAEP